MNPGEPHIEVRDLTVAYGSEVILKNVSFTVNRGDVFIIMGGSGTGKSTILRSMVGLLPPARGEILYDGLGFWGAGIEEQQQVMRRFGVLYQGGALWSSLTLAENVALPLRQYTDLDAAAIGEIVSLKLALVGLAGFGDHYPAEISGGMKKRAALARAMALDPDILFFDEPSAGLDPISAHRLDELILELRDSLGATVVVVTHELASIFAIGNNSVFLDGRARTVKACGDPSRLLAASDDPAVVAFLTRGEGRSPHGRPPGAGRPPILGQPPHAGRPTASPEAP